MRPLTEEMEAYRRKQWAKSPLVIDTDFVCTNCLGKNRDQEVRETPSGIWCEKHYLELPSCNCCFEPVIRIRERGKDGLIHLCRDHFQDETYGTSELPIVKLDREPRLLRYLRLKMRHTSAHPDAPPSRACYKLGEVTVHCYGVNGGYCQCGAHKSPKHWS